jgi:hypothetical protein
VRCLACVAVPATRDPLLTSQRPGSRAWCNCRICRVFRSPRTRSSPKTADTCDLRRLPRQRESDRKRGFAGASQSPLTDSNRRPPPYHGGFAAALAGMSRHSRSRFSCKSQPTGVSLVPAVLSLRYPSGTRETLPVLTTSFRHRCGRWDLGQAPELSRRISATRAGCSREAKCPVSGSEIDRAALSKARLASRSGMCDQS